MPDLFGGRLLGVRTAPAGRQRPAPGALARAGTAVLVVGALVGVAGCTHDSSDAAGTSPADSQTLLTDLPDPPELPANPARDNVEAAVAAYQNYVAVRDTVRQDHFRDWETKVLPLTSADEADWVASFFSQAVELGRYQVGANTVSHIKLAGEGYSEDPTGAGHERVVLEACLDTSGAQALGAEGQDTDVPGSRGRFVATVTVQHLTVFDEQGAVVEDPYDQSWWRVAGEDLDRERPC